MRITFVTRKFGNVERNSRCDVLHFTPDRVARLFLDCNGVFAINAYITGMDKTSLDTSSGTLLGCPEGGCPRHVERNYVPLFGVTQSNVDLRNYVLLFGVAQSNVDLSNYVMSLQIVI